MTAAGTPHSPSGRPRQSFSLTSPERDLRSLYHKHFCDRRKERQLFSTGAFFVTFATVRGITHAIRAERGPFKLKARVEVGRHVRERGNLLAPQAARATPLPGMQADIVRL